MGYYTEKMTPEEIEEAINNACASVEFEGLKPSEESKKICRKYLSGEITDEEADAEILKLYGIKKVSGGYNHAKKNT